MYFMAKSCIHIVRPPKPDQNMPYLSTYITSRYQIPPKHSNSSEMGKFRGSAQNSGYRGKLWSLVIQVTHTFWNTIQCNIITVLRTYRDLWNANVKGGKWTLVVPSRRKISHQCHLHIHFIQNETLCLDVWPKHLRSAVYKFINQHHQCWQ